VTTTAHPGQAVSDPIGLIVDLIAAVERQMEPEQIRTVVTAVAGGRAKSRRLASVLADRPEVLADGQSPAPRAVGDLLIALRKAGASTVSPPCCAECGKQLRTLQHRGQDWYCNVSGHNLSPALPAETPGESLHGTGPDNRDASSARTPTDATPSR
jgi:hypothetical protein